MVPLQKVPKRVAGTHDFDYEIVLHIEGTVVDGNHISLADFSFLWDGNLTVY